MRKRKALILFVIRLESVIINIHILDPITVKPQDSR